jgi:hypothetical protein
VYVNAILVVMKIYNIYGYIMYRVVVEMCVACLLDEGFFLLYFVVFINRRAATKSWASWWWHRARRQSSRSRCCCYPPVVVPLVANRPRSWPSVPHRQ